MNFTLESIECLKYLIKKDTNFLTNHNLMDYSLLFGVFKIQDKALLEKNIPSLTNMFISKFKHYVYSISIIDYLQSYSAQKKLENVLKSIGNPSKKDKLSCLPPQEYAKRFMKFMFCTVLKSCS